ncbi:MAG: hypothetical protein COU25_01190 [Candidatus Levybacteria bacterium CG10_big_fil_rev_8_21_14_0_10_35_13]|nr:MAG: hypothetical protein COU25_01190 [Candidatus Levybacteria bacterium CG10_big_fil_rev_8_21_14_0_10_35_13]
MAAVSERILERRGFIRRPQHGEVGIGQRPAVTEADRNRAYITGFVNDYLQSPEAEIVEAFKKIKSGSVINAFRKTELFSQTHAYALNRADRVGNMDEGFGWFSGDLYSKIAWLYLASRLPRGFTVLPEDYTMELSKEVGGIKTKKNQIGAEIAEDRRYVPDGLLVDDNGRILTVYEYTISNDYYKFITQSAGFIHYRKGLGEVAKDANLVFIVPALPKEERDRMRERVERELSGNGYNGIQIGIDSLPFAYGEFAGFLGYFMATHRAGKETPTIKELIAAKEALLSLELPKHAVRMELARQIDRMFTIGDSEAVLYVAAHGSKHEKSLSAKNTGIITTPRMSPKALGEPELFRLEK